MKKNSFIFKKEAELEYSIILYIHVPSHTKEFYNLEIKRDAAPGYLIPVPKELMQNYALHRFEQLLQDKIHIH